MTPTDCFLCGEPVRAKTVEFGNRTYFECNSAECGDDEISLNAMARLANNPLFKLRAMQEANLSRREGAYFEITAGSASEVTGTRIKRCEAD